MVKIKVQLGLKICLATDQNKYENLEFQFNWLYTYLGVVVDTESFVAIKIT